MVRILAIALETVGICAIIGGLVFEAQVHAQIGLIVISGGAALIAIGALLYAKIYKNWRR
ncbi:MAG TPA: histidine kinase [Dehalococcoidia bacterium]|nr:histidine kinase [Dehalococcoidia bacterium]